jgi:hypothetical protein
MKRNYFKIFALLLVVGFMCSSVAMASGHEESVTGTVEQTDQGFVISADTGEKIKLMGEEDALAGMVGKQVKATGTVEEGAEGKSLNISNIEEVK